MDNYKPRVRNGGRLDDPDPTRKREQENGKEEKDVPGPSHIGGSHTHKYG